MIFIYILKNALVSIIRNKGRNILIALIILVVAAASTVALAIISSANKVVEAYENKYNIEATLEMDRKSVMKNLTDSGSQSEKIQKFGEIPTLTIEEIDAYGDSKYLSSYYYTYSVGVNSDLEEATDTLEKTTTTTTTTTKRRKMPSFDGMPPGVPGGSSGYSETKTTKKTEVITNPNALNGKFTLVGYSSFEGMNEFITGNYTITSGSVEFGSNYCVINEELAEINKLSVGDTIKITNPNNSKLTYELVIKGIFKDNTESEFAMYTDSVNKIITNADFVKTLTSADSTLKYSINPTFILKDKNSSEAFIKEVSDKGLSEYYKVSTNIEKLESETKSVKNVKTFATTFLIITLIISIVVLLVINMINVRERKYEIGVLRTIGMSKFKVILKFVLELMIVATVGLIIGAAVGSYASVPVANKLMESEIASSKEEKEDIRKNFGDFENFNPGKINGTTNIDSVSEINAVVNMHVLAKLLLIGLFITLISSLSAMISIANFRPLTILKERS